jgi:hypothetical protein
MHNSTWKLEIKLNIKIMARKKRLIDYVCSRGKIKPLMKKYVFWEARERNYLTLSRTNAGGGVHTPTF